MKKLFLFFGAKNRRIAELEKMNNHQSKRIIKLEDLCSRSAKALNDLHPRRSGVFQTYVSTDEYVRQLKNDLYNRNF